MIHNGRVMDITFDFLRTNNQCILRMHNIYIYTYAVIDF